MTPTDRIIHSIRVDALLKASMVRCSLRRDDRKLTPWIVEAFECTVIREDFASLSDKEQDQYRQHMHEIENDPAFKATFDRHLAAFAKVKWNR